MICGPWRADLPPETAQVLARNPFKREWSKRWREIVRADPCAWCGGAGGAVDHIAPQSRCRPGRRKSWTNLTGACADCNGRRGDAPVLQWLADPETARTAAEATRRGDEPRRQLLSRLRSTLIHRAWEIRDTPDATRARTRPAILAETRNRRPMKQTLSLTILLAGTMGPWLPVHGMLPSADPVWTAHAETPRTAREEAAPENPPPVAEPTPTTEGKQETAASEERTTEVERQLQRLQDRRRNLTIEIAELQLERLKLERTRTTTLELAAERRSIVERLDDLSRNVVRLTTLVAILVEQHEPGNGAETSADSERQEDPQGHPEEES